MLRTQPVTIAVEQARELVRARLGEWSASHLEETVAVVAVELVANVVRHAQTPFELRLWREESHIVVEVRDHDDHLPDVVPAGPNDERGRGMHIVEALASSWGAAPVLGGKVVWARIELPRE